MNVSFHTLGCRLNQSESAILAQTFIDAGYQVVDEEKPADVCVVNTCTVTGVSDAKCRNSIRRLIRQNPSARVAVIGCYAESGFAALGEIEGVDVIVGNQEKLNLLKYLPEEKNNRATLVRDRIIKEDFTIETIGQSTSRARTSLKIQDGCNFMCSFCIIPYVRGRSRSRVLENLLDEARALRDRDFHELVLTGVNIGTYEQEGRGIIDVVDALNDLGISRVRISSIEPTTVPDGLLERMADPAHNLVPYLHLPLQSASDRVLRWMNRHYTAAEYSAFIREVKKRVPGVMIGTDILAGVPTETSADFQATLDFLRDEPIDYAHAFTYSEREGTPAAKEVQVPHEVRKERTLRIMSQGNAKRAEFSSQFLGCEVEVLVEEHAEGYWQGRTANFMLVKFRAAGDLQNRFARVRVVEVCGEWVRGEFCA